MREVSDHHSTDAGVMLLRLLLAFTLIPLVELFLLLRFAQLTGPLTTVAVVIITGVIGSLLARRQGLLTWRRFRMALAEGRMPAREIQDGLLIAFAAALLLTPGLLTDAIGFLLLIPRFRAVARRYMASRLAGRFRLSVDSLGRGPARGFGSTTVEAEGVRPVDAADAGQRGTHRVGSSFRPTP